MPSLRRILASRANGAHSLGPVTPEGKARSSCNTIRHGLLAKCVVLSNGFPAGFQELHDQFVNRFGPADGVEDGLLEEMVAASGRLRRVWALETRLLDDALAAQPPGDELGRVTAAFSSLASRPELALIHRYETRLHNVYQRALFNFLLLRTSAVPNEPNDTVAVPALAPAESASSAPPSSPPSCGVPAVPNEPNSSLPVPVLPPGS